MQIILRLRPVSRQNAGMNPLVIRRATVDDMPALQSLWASMRLRGDHLERRLTDFQVVESGGEFAGSIAVEFSPSSARLHSEGYTDFSVADAARQLFWERIQTLAANHGVFRIWTQEDSPFWKHWGFQPANAELLERLPDEWRQHEGSWLTLELKNEDAINAALKHQFDGLALEERRQTAQVIGRARKLRLFITVAGFVVGIIGLALAFYLMMRNPMIRPH